MRSFISYRIPASKEALEWLRAFNLEDRGLQIQGACPPDAGVWMVGHGEQRSNGGELIEANIKFIYRDLERAVSAFRSAADRLCFPINSSLVHISSEREDGQFGFTTLSQW